MHRNAILSAASSVLTTTATVSVKPDGKISAVATMRPFATIMEDATMLLRFRQRLQINASAEASGAGLSARTVRATTEVHVTRTECANALTAGMVPTAVCVRKLVKKEATALHPGLLPCTAFARVVPCTVRMPS